MCRNKDSMMRQDCIVTSLGKAAFTLSSVYATCKQVDDESIKVFEP